MPTEPSGEWTSEGPSWVPELRAIGVAQLYPLPIASAAFQDGSADDSRRLNDGEIRTFLLRARTARETMQPRHENKDFASCFACPSVPRKLANRSRHCARQARYCVI